MTYDVAVRTVAASPTAVVAQRTTWDEFPRLWDQLLDEVYALVRAGGVAKAGHNVMLYRDDVPNVEVGLQVAGPFGANGRVILSELPAGRVATTVHRGTYDGLGAAHEAVHAWCAKNGHELTRTRWEVYGDWHEDPTQVETEISWVLR